MISLDHISFRYPKSEKNILDGAGAVFEKGKMYAITGPSGSGKSTLLSLIAGIEVPQEGEIRIDGSRIDRDAIRKHNIAFVFQNYMLFPYLNAVENVDLAVDIRVPKKAGCRKDTKELLTSLGIREQDLKRKVCKLSGGEQQRVGIARALALGAPYILADEPTGNLDRETAEKIIRLLGRITHRENKCLIVVTHSEAVRDSADEAFALVDGRLLRQEKAHG